MEERARKLAKLLDVHKQLKQLHESRRAGFLRDAAEAQAEAEAIAARFDAAGSLSGMFPALYHACRNAALVRAAQAAAAADTEGRKLAEIALREKSIGQAQSLAAAKAERSEAERTLLEWVEGRTARTSPDQPPASFPR